MAKFRQIIGFSGGGVRGIISSIWLDHMVKQGLVNLDDAYSISGTSTGSIIAAALCEPNPFSPEEISDLFSDLSSHIFKRKTWRPVWLDSVLFFAPHDTKRLRDVLFQNIGNVKLGECKRRFVCVTYSLNSKINNTEYASSPVVIHSHGSPFRHNNYLDYSLADCVTGSCAAPSYFKPYEFNHGERTHLWTDGGICSNASVLSNYLICRDRYSGEKIRTKDVSALLIGNGTKYSHETSKSLSGWKTPRMLRAIKNSLVQANELYEVKSLRRLLRNNFYYFNCPLPKEVALDDYRKTQFMADFAKSKTQHMGMLSAWLKGYFV